MQADETDDPADDADELNEIMEFGRRAEDFISGSAPTKELRNFGAIFNNQKNKNVNCQLNHIYR